MQIRNIFCAVLGLGAIVGAGVVPPTSDQPGAAPPNGPRVAEPTRWALVGATVHVSPSSTIEQATVFIEDGVIVSVTDRPGDDLAGDGWRVRDLSGQHVYAGLIDAFVPVETPVLQSARTGGHWSSVITPENRALAGNGLTSAQRGQLRKSGFVAAAISPAGGVMRGHAAVVSTADVSSDASESRPTVYAEDVYQVCAIESAGAGRVYPTSHMGAMALLRQTMSDAAWWRESGEPSPSYLEAVDPTSTPMWFDTRHELEGLLAGKLALEFAIAPAQIVLIGSGTEFRRLDALAAQGNAVVVPLRFPATPDVKTIAGNQRTTLNDLMLWEQAPTNPRRLDDAGVTVAVTTSKLPRGQHFWGNYRKAVDAGLSPDRALAMVTTIPAALLGVEDRLGTIEGGKAASLVVTDGPIFEDEAKILDVWIEGQRYELAQPEDDSLDGGWTVGVVGTAFKMGLIVKGSEITCIEGDARNKARKIQIDLPNISFLVDDEDDGTGTYVMSGALVGERMRGTGLAADGTAFEWIASRDEQWLGDEDDDAEKGSKENDKAEIADRAPAQLGGQPFGAYAMEQVPDQESVLFVNATVWTQGEAGVIENGFVWIAGGTVRAVGAMADAPDLGRMRLVDLKGKHITPGLIDAHSHTGLFRFGVNESGQAVTAECQIGDSLDPAHINWYRQLAGGVTTANLLHGSANPIGGQSQIVKVRWGAHRPEDMFFEGAMPGIKFALGENVKQSNWGDDYTSRYPQTRMGVETLMRDRFMAAREYASGQDRRDFELEALAQILAGERLVHSHSYRQDEILMLCRIAEEFGFEIGTFQHGLEVYKVAETVREHARGASIFSDWWQYKVEVQDAIPYAGPLQTEAGVLTSYNSDSDELARRMSWEAAKAVKYSDGELQGAEALAFVTMNPAIQLGIDQRVGSIEVGKDADLAIWTGDPLSSLSRCVATWVDGREYFSIERDAAHRARIASERERLIQKALGSPAIDDSDSAGEAGEGDDEDDLVDPEQRRQDWLLIEQLRAGELDGCDLFDHEARVLRRIGE